MSHTRHKYLSRDPIHLLWNILPEVHNVDQILLKAEKFIKVTSMRSGQPGVNAQEYSKYQIMVPSKPEQDKISDCFRSLDNLITLHQRKLEKLKILKKACLEKMFV